MPLWSNTKYYTANYTLIPTLILIYGQVKKTKKFGVDPRASWNHIQSARRRPNKPWRRRPTEADVAGGPRPTLRLQAIASRRAGGWSSPPIPTPARLSAGGWHRRICFPRLPASRVVGRRGCRRRATQFPLQPPLGSPLHQLRRRPVLPCVKASSSCPLASPRGCVRRHQVPLHCWTQLPLANFVHTVHTSLKFELCILPILQFLGRTSHLSSRVHMRPEITQTIRTVDSSVFFIFYTIFRFF
jgi:hypothetical protein